MTRTLLVNHGHTGKIHATRLVNLVNSGPLAKSGHQR